MSKCCVPNCNTTYGEYSFPVDEPIRSKWISAIKTNHQFCKDRIWKPTSKSVICSLHFEEDCFCTHQIAGIPVLSKKLLPHAVPSLQLECKPRRQRKQPDDDVNKTHNTLFDDQVTIIKPRCAERFILETVDNPVAVNTQLKLEVNTLTEEYVTFKSEYETHYVDMDNVEGDDIATQDLTGVGSFSVFKAIVGKAKSMMEDDKEASPKLSAQAMLVFTKLWLNIPDQLLSVVYSLSVERVRQICREWTRTVSTVLRKDMVARVDQMMSAGDWKTTSHCFYVGHITVTRERQGDQSSQALPWMKELKADREFCTQHAVCVVADNGQVVYISSLLDEGASLLAVLSDAAPFLKMLQDSDKVYLLPTEQVVFKKDLELGVTLELDSDNKFLPTSERSFVYCEEVLKKANGYQILTAGLESDFDNLIDDLVNVCALGSSLSFRHRF